MMNCPQRRSRNPERGTRNLERGTWNSELGTFNAQSGFLLVTAIFLLVILAALGAFILTISGTQQTSSALDVQGARAYQAARAGIEWASYQAANTSCGGYLKRTVTIDHTKVPNTDQSNFPMLFSGTYSYLATVANGGKVTNASGFDIIFQDSSGTKLDHEIESYNAVTGAVNFWVRVPTVSHTTDTVIYLCYGNAAISTSQENKTGVWDTNFKGVWHLKENPAGAAPQMKDSTSNSNDATAFTMTSGQQVAGKIDGNLNFDNTSSDYLAVPHQSYFQQVPLTAELWINNTTLPSVLGHQVKNFWKEKSASPWQSWLIWTDNTNNTINFVLQDSAGNWQPIPANSAAAANTWYHVVGTLDASYNMKLYINGVQQTATLNPGSMASSDNPLNIGGWSGFYGINGMQDEVRFSNVVRSGDWILTEYNNQSSPSTFYTLGAETSAACNTTLTGMGGTLSGFTATVTCSSTTYTEGGNTWTVYQITSTGCNLTTGSCPPATPGSGYVERQLQATLTK